MCDRFDRAAPRLEKFYDRAGFVLIPVVGVQDAFWARHPLPAREICDALFEAQGAERRGLDDQPPSHYEPMRRDYKSLGSILLRQRFKRCGLSKSVSNA